jgi:hypothetical protein
VAKRRGGRRSHRMTPKRRAALRKAQLASARKRSRLAGVGSHISRNRKAYITAGVIGGAVLGHKLSGSELKIRKGSNIGFASGNRMPQGFRTTGGRREQTVHLGIRDTRFSVGYRLGRQTQSIQTGPLRKPIDRDAIPFYNPKAKTRGWPHVGAPQARKINDRLREKGMLQ